MRPRDPSVIPHRPWCRKGAVEQTHRDGSVSEIKCFRRWRHGRSCECATPAEKRAGTTCTGAISPRLAMSINISIASHFHELLWRTTCTDILDGPLPQLLH